MIGTDMIELPDVGLELWHPRCLPQMLRAFADTVETKPSDTAAGELGPSDTDGDATPDMGMGATLSRKPTAFDMHHGDDPLHGDRLFIDHLHSHCVFLQEKSLAHRARRRPAAADKHCQ